MCAPLPLTSHPTTACFINLKNEIRASLERQGISCLIASRDIPAGEQYGAPIIKAIRRCTLTVLMLTKEFNQSKPVANDIKRALSYQKRLSTDDAGVHMTTLDNHWRIRNYEKRIAELQKKCGPSAPALSIGPSGMDSVQLIPAGRGLGGFVREFIQ